MARIHKVEFYLVDYNDMYETGEDVLNEAENKLYGLIQCPTWKTSTEFEWHDDINLNYSSCSKEDCEKYFPQKQTIISLGLLCKED